MLQLNRIITGILTAFLGYVLPYGQMSLWGLSLKPQMYNLCLISFLYYFTTYNNYTIIRIISLLITSSISKDLNTKLDNARQLIRLKGEYRIGPHNKEVLSIIFGSLLGDGHAGKRKSGLGTRITFYQESSHVEYLIYLHGLLSKLGYCNPSTPNIGTRLGVGGKVRKTVRFATWTYTSFNWIHDLWYSNGKKTVPCNIDLYLTPLALAIWIMDDGAKAGKGLKFCTNCFSYKDCLKLVNVLSNKFNIKSTVHSAGADNQYVIYVWKESMNELRKIVKPYMIREMRYKID